MCISKALVCIQIIIIKINKNSTKFFKKNNNNNILDRKTEANMLREHIVQYPLK